MDEPRTKKLMNEAGDIVREMVEGVAAVHPGIVRLHPEDWRVVLRAAGEPAAKVGIVVGGGSGHEPAFLGYVGRGLATAAVIGDVFTSPTPEPILTAARAAAGPEGVLFLYGNYAGDVLNFDMAAELAEAEGIAVRTVLGADDVAAAPVERAEERRGIAGGVFLFKIAGAAAAAGWPLVEVERVAKKAVGAMRSMGVALAPCSLPASLRPNFAIAPDEMEIGLGIHGEKGIMSGPLEPADRVTGQLFERLQGELALQPGERCAVLVNGLGATSFMECHVVARRLLQLLSGAGVLAHHVRVGEYVTSLEMAGLSLTLMRLDDELAGLLEAPAEGIAWSTRPQG
ncbi:MAG TPA: dihydroxyacetone kinase subunit DhaK [Geminicoccaceae bacterium]|jgi:dihydroxyacetone kinase|nr:dihydroxyacetone kinase subunit DhaK [Geminicoccaceae bacterium]